MYILDDGQYCSVTRARFREEEGVIWIEYITGMSSNPTNLMVQEQNDVWQTVDPEEVSIDVPEEYLSIAEDILINWLSESLVIRADKPEEEFMRVADQWPDPVFNPKG